MTKRVRRSVAELDRDLRELQRLRDARLRRAKDLQDYCARLRDLLRQAETNLRRVLGSGQSTPHRAVLTTPASLAAKLAGKPAKPPTASELVAAAKEVARPVAAKTAVTAKATHAAPEPSLADAIYAVLRNSEPLSLKQLVAALRAEYPRAVRFTPAGPNFDKVVLNCLAHNFQRFTHDRDARRHSVHRG